MPSRGVRVLQVCIRGRRCCGFPLGLSTGCYSETTQRKKSPKVKQPSIIHSQPTEQESGMDLPNLALLAWMTARITPRGTLGGLSSSSLHRTRGDTTQNTREYYQNGCHQDHPKHDGGVQVCRGPESEMSESPTQEHFHTQTARLPPKNM